MQSRQLAVLTCLVCMCLPAPVPAQTAEATSDDQAVELGHEALARYHRGEWQAAHDEFEKADQLRHSAVFKLYAARADRNLGHFLEAIATYQAVAAEKVPEGLPEVVAIWEAAAADAAIELEETRRRTPSVRISVKDEAADHISLKIDGVLFRSPLPPVVELNPGRHHFEATAGLRQTTRAVELAEGQQLIPVELALPPLATSTPASRSAAVLRRTVVRQRESHSLGLPPLLAFVVGASGLIVGVVAGSLVYADSRDIKKNCVGTHCLASDQSKASSASSLGQLATAGFVVGGLGLATGVTLVLLHGASAAGSRSNVPTPTVALSISMDLHDL